MTETSTKQTLPTVSEFIKEVYRRMVERWEFLVYTLLLVILSFVPFFIGLVVVVLAAMDLQEIAAPTIYDISDGMIIGLGLAGVGVVIMVVVSIVTAGALLHHFGRFAEATTFRASLRFGWRHLLSLLWIGILVALIMTGASILLLLPGLIAMVYLLFAQLTLATEGRRGFAALLRSTELVRGAFWGIFGRVVALWLVLYIFSLAVTTLNEILQPVGEIGGLFAALFILAIGIADIAIHIVLGWGLVVGLGVLYEYRVTAVPAQAQVRRSGAAWIYRFCLLLGVTVFVLLGWGSYALFSHIGSQNEADDLEDYWFLEEGASAASLIGSWPSL